MTTNDSTCPIMMNRRNPFLLFCLIFVATGSLHSQSNNIQKTNLPKVNFPIRTSADGRYLVDKNNVPFPILGRTSWFVISQPVSGYQIFIDHTVSLGYNSIEMMGITHDPRANHPPFNGDGDMPFLKRLDGSPWKGSLVYTNIKKEAPDLTTPNEKYWAYIDNFLSYCESKGVLVFFFPGYVGYPDTNQGWMEELVANGSKAEAFGAWIAKRYKNQPNLVWMLLGDMGTFNTERKNAEAALIKGLKSVTGQQSIHYSSEAGSGQNSTDQTDFADQITLNGVYTWDSVGIPKQGRHAYSLQPVMPAFLLEQPYDEEGPDGNSVNPHASQPVRRFQWWGWLSTIGGYISGNGYVWPFVDPHWKNHLDTQGSRDMSHLNNFIRSISWWELVPSGLNGMRNLITSGGGIETNQDYIAAAANPTGTLLVAYVPPAHQGGFTVNTTGMGEILDASWFDPTSGIFLKLSDSTPDKKGTRKFTPPARNSVGQHDWVLVVRRADK